MPRTRYKLTPEIQQAIVAYIRAGAFPHVAAEAAGIPQQTFEIWLNRHQRPNCPKALRLFADAVLQAQAQARLAAEMSVLKEDPVTWLKSGPGKESSTTKGWTNPRKPLIQDNRQVNLLLSPQLASIFGAILQVLAPFPDARAAVAEAINALKPQTPALPPP